MKINNATAPLTNNQIQVGAWLSLNHPALAHCPSVRVISRDVDRFGDVSFAVQLPSGTVWHVDASRLAR